MTRFNLTGQFAFNEDLLYYSELTFKVISTPINILTFFIIYFYSTPDMKDYKIHLLLYQFASASLDFLIGVLGSPILFLPILCGTGQGWLHSLFGVSPYALYIIIFTYMSFDVHFIALGPIFYRWQHVLPQDSWMKAKGPVTRILCEYGYLTFATLPVPFVYLAAGDDIDIIKKEFRIKYPNDAELADVEGIYWFNIEKHPEFMYGLLYQFGWLIYAVVMIGMCNISMVLTLNQLRVHMSAATRRMHFRFLRMIALQTMVPTVWLVVPMVYVMTIIIEDIRFHRIQDVNNLAVVLISSHGLVVSIYLLSSNQAYRMTLYSFFAVPIRKLFGMPEHAPFSAATSALGPSSAANVATVL